MRLLKKMCVQQPGALNNPSLRYIDSLHYIVCMGLDFEFLNLEQKYIRKDVRIAHKINFIDTPIKVYRGQHYVLYNIQHFTNKLEYQLQQIVCIIDSMSKFLTQENIYYIVITIVERDTRKYHEFIARYCYECAARVLSLIHI